MSREGEGYSDGSLTIVVNMGEPTPRAVGTVSESLSDSGCSIPLDDCEWHQILVMTWQIGITHREWKAVEKIHVLFLPFAKLLHILGIHLTSFRGTTSGSFVQRRWCTNAHGFREPVGLVQEDGTHREHCRLRSREFVLRVGVRPEVELALDESYEGGPFQPFPVVVAVESAVQEK
jgi:hypothetical protein